MADNYLKILLKLINNNEDTALLVKQGLTYSQISKLINDAIVEEYLKETDTFELVLTRKGFDEVGNNLKCLNIINKEKWIRNDEKYRIDKIGIDDIYLPTNEESKDLV